MCFLTGYFYGQVQVYESASLGTTTPSKKTTTETAAAQPDTTAPSVSLDKVKALFTDKKNLIFGNPNSKLLFVEFADPSCPYCHIAAGKNGELNKQVGDRFKLKADGGTYLAPVVEMKKLVDQGKAAFVWIFTSGHGNGELATQAFYCAQDQGKFWPVHDLLMSNAGYSLINDTVKNDKSKIPQLADFLKGVANAQKLQDCLTSGKYADRIQADQAIAREYGAQGTPNFFVNDKNFSGAYSFTDMQSAVDAGLK